MIGKLMAFGADRNEALARMRRALGFTVIEGISTNLSLHERILDDGDFIRGRFTTQYLDGFLSRS